jgi:tetratricopeptide (TPR) repeat protein
MPRWLSEGISVFEEAQANPAWATALDPRFRSRLLDPKLTPLSRLSSAFLTAESALDIQFAYYESALAVEFLVGKFGPTFLNRLLDDLGAGVLMDEALPARTQLSLVQLDTEFALFARQKAESFAPGATWEEEIPESAGSVALAAWIDQHPKSFDGLRELASKLVAEKKWDEALPILERFKSLEPNYVGADNAYAMLAAVHHQRADSVSERAVLEEWTSHDAGASTAFLRLMELCESTQDWPALADNARKLLAVNPLIVAPHRQLARAAEQLGNRDEAIEAYRAVALLDDTDPADVHYRLASLLRDSGNFSDARREVLRALEEAPRFLDAHRLLLEIVESEQTGASTNRSAGDATP